MEAQDRTFQTGHSSDVLRASLLTTHRPTENDSATRRDGVGCIYVFICLSSRGIGTESTRQKSSSGMCSRVLKTPHRHTCPDWRNDEYMHTHTHTHTHIHTHSLSHTHTHTSGRASDAGHKRPIINFLHMNAYESHE